MLNWNGLKSLSKPASRSSASNLAQHKLNKVAWRLERIQAKLICLKFSLSLKISSAWLKLFKQAWLATISNYEAENYFSKFKLLDKTNQISQSDLKVTDVFIFIFFFIYKLLLYLIGKYRYLCWYFISTSGGNWRINFKYKT